MKSAAEGARRAVDEYVAELESKVLPRATGAYALGTAAVEARYRAEELIDTPAAGMLAIGERELRRLQADFAATAARVDPSRPGRSAIDVWREVLDDHPQRGELAAAAQKTVDELFVFIRERRLVDLPEGEARRRRRRAAVRSRPRVDAFVAAARAASGEELLLRHRRAGGLAGRPAERVAAEVQLPDARRHLRARSRPGHYVHSLFMRRTPGRSGASGSD